MNQEEKLKTIYDEFGARMKDIAEETLGNLVTEFLPYAESDLEQNVYSYSRQLIKSFLLNKPNYDWMDKDVFEDLNSEEVRRKMLDDWREEIVNDIIEDQAKEIKRLKEQVSWFETLNESYQRRGF